MAESKARLEEGAIVDERYKIVKWLDHGAMGEVYTCQHVSLSEKIYVMKVLKPEIVKDENMMSRFRNEVLTAFDISHPYVVRAYEFIQVDDFVAYTMEYVDGGSLADKFDSDQEVPIDEVVRYLIQVCSGLQALHEQNIIHRDIKPENILLTKKGEVKISDFGISFVDQKSRLTEHGAMVGSTNYLAPEYITDMRFDERCDIYALGIVAYELVTGQDPYEAESSYAQIQKRIQYDPESPKLHRPDCPDRLVAIILKAMSRNPDERYQSCEEMMAELLKLQNGKSAPGPSVFTKKSVSLKLEDVDVEQEPDELKEHITELRNEYRSEVIDLRAVAKNKAEASLENKSKVVALPASESAQEANKSPLRLVSYILFLAVILLAGFAYQQGLLSQNQEPAVVIDQQLIDNIAAQSQLQEDLQVAEQALPGKFSFSTLTPQWIASGKLLLKKGKLNDLRLKLVPNENFEKLRFFIKSINSSKRISVKSDDTNFVYIARATVNIFDEGKSYAKQTTIKVHGEFSEFRDQLSLKFLVPEELNITNRGAPYFLNYDGAELTLYALGEFDLDKSLITPLK